MARTSFFDDNRNRSYPLVETLHIPLSTLVDFGCLMGIASGYVEGTHGIWLERIDRSGDDFTFQFNTDAPGIIDQKLLFTFPLSSERYSTQFADCAAMDHHVSLSHSLSCLEDAQWSGFMVLGDLTELAAILTTDGGIVESSNVEPALVRSLVQGYVRTLNLANADRTRATTPANCQQLAGTYDAMHLSMLCLTGNIRFTPGYNCKIEQDVPNNAIIIGAADPAEESTEAGQPCEEIPLFDGEAAPTGRTRLDGALGCDEVFRSVNGLGGPQVAILSGTGVNLTFDTDNHKILVDVNMHNLAVCSQFTDETDDPDAACSYSELQPNTGCGPL